MKKNKISKNWINKQKRDIFVRKSLVDGYRARSAYKLLEINEKFKIFKNGNSVIDLGASPGSWSQYVLKTVKSVLVEIDESFIEQSKQSTKYLLDAGLTLSEKHILLENSSQFNQLWIRE